MSTRNLLSRRSCHLCTLCTALAAVLLTASAASGQAPSITGTWQMDASKSQLADGRTITLKVESIANKLKLNSIVRDKAGEEVTTEFICSVDGKDCDFNESAHKSKVSMWYLGGALNVCKTDGPPGDVVNEWKLQPSPDGKELTLTITHIEPSATPETLVFNKKSS